MPNASPVAATPGDAIAPDALVWLVGSLAGLYRRPFDATLVRKHFVPPFDVPSIIEALEEHGLKAGINAWPSEEWSGIPMPAVVFMREDPSPCESAAPSVSPSTDSIADAPRVPVLVVKSDGHTLAVVQPGRKSPETITVGQLRARCMPWLLLVSESDPPESDEVLEQDATRRKPVPFGFRWFVPELLKHKRIWRDVLLASFTIQLVGLATPLFTQVIIDKVIAHQTHSTLIVLGIALFAFMLFSATMTWLRQYLVLHTGNRVDAVLGGRVFQHLLRLPLPYFEHRPTAPPARWSRACRASRRCASSSPARPSRCCSTSRSCSSSWR